MGNYKENPKTKGSGIVCAIPQTGRCPNGCDDCFFQSGRSYLEPLDLNLPNMPIPVYDHQVVRVNDGNDSAVKIDKVLSDTMHFKDKFYNTARHEALKDLAPHPVVLTINRGTLVDRSWDAIDAAPENLMFVRFRTNMWNLELMDQAITYYSDMEVPIILTFMAYFSESIPLEYNRFYTYRKRTLNSYWAITTAAWELVMQRNRHNKWVYSCGKIEGELGTTACRHCGNCLREYHATMERISHG